MPSLHSSGVITPGQFGPINVDLLPAIMALILIISWTGMPSVMHAITGISASIASTIEANANLGGT